MIFKGRRRVFRRRCAPSSGRGVAGFTRAGAAAPGSGSNRLHRLDDQERLALRATLVAHRGTRVWCRGPELQVERARPSGERVTGPGRVDRGAPGRGRGGRRRTPHLVQWGRAAGVTRHTAAACITAAAVRTRRRSITVVASPNSRLTWISVKVRVVQKLGARALYEGQRSRGAGLHPFRGHVWSRTPGPKGDLAREPPTGPVQPGRLDGRPL